MDKIMQSVYEEIKTPFKYGAVLKHEGEFCDCATIFQKDGIWYMMYTAIDPNDKEMGYDTYLAKSTDLLNWEKLGKVMTRNIKMGTWDSNQRDGGFAILSTKWGEGNEIESFDGKYWCSYIGGNLIGYEPDPLCIGMAYTDDPTAPREWTRLSNPVLKNNDADARWFEKKTLYKSFIIKDISLDSRFIMFYNAKGEDNKERIGIALSNDMINWERYGKEPIVDNTERQGNHISGDPQVIKIGDVWVMNYFIAENGCAYDTFACSKDLVNWAKWTGEPTIKPSEEFDNLYAHKPFLLKHKGVVYHFYCACSDKGERFLALATSKPIK